MVNDENKTKQTQDDDVQEEVAQDDVDDVEFEMDDDALENTRDTAEKKIDRLKKKLEKCEADRKTYLDNWQRAQADFMNARKMDEEEKRRAIQFASRSFVEKLIPIVDSFDSAFADKEGYENTPTGWRDGVDGIYKQVTGLLSSLGVSSFEPTGVAFDPRKHEAMSTEAVTDKTQDDIVLKVLQKGYEFNGEVIRTAKVVVGVFQE